MHGAEFGFAVSPLMNMPHFALIVEITPLNLTTVLKNTYITGFLGSYQTPNPHIPPYNKYATYLTTYVG